jgi:hypothetical protein
MRAIPENWTAAISAMEAAGLHVAKIEAIKNWKGLSPGQRVVALVITCLEHIERKPIGSREVALFTGMPADRIEKIFTGVDHPPYRWGTLEHRGWVFLASQTLEYGEV